VKFTKNIDLLHVEELKEVVLINNLIVQTIKKSNFFVLNLKFELVLELNLLQMSFFFQLLRNCQF